MLTQFDVWLRPLTGRTCRVRVDGQQNANWLLARLCTAYITKTSEPMQQERNSTFFTFEVHYPRQYSHNMLKNLVEGFPPVRLQVGFGTISTRTDGSGTSSDTGA